tara:strand:- start:5115 stop:6332 length:1218 start_codon:yes stop_codon:yes gene_type:complete
MNQVFISNNRAGQMLSAKAWTDMVHLAGGADDGSATAMFGVWDPYAQVFLDGTTAALGLIAPQAVTALAAAGGTFATAQQGTIIADGTGVTSDHSTMANSDEVINILPSSPAWLNRAFQLVQAMPSGQPVASPIIHTNQVKRLRWDPNNAPVLHKQTVADSGLSAIAIGDVLQMVLVTRFPGDVARYEAQINPSGSVTNVSPAVSAAFDNPKRIYKSIEFTATTTNVANMHDAFVDAIIADTTHDLHKLVTVTVDSNDLVVEAKFQGQIIDVFVTLNGDKSHGVSTDLAPELGVGSFAEVLSAEKKAQYSQGHFNRMYLPTGGVTSASQTPGGVSSTQTANYDRLVIEYYNANGNMPGFNGQGNMSTATVYFPANGDHSDQSEGLAIEATWGLINAPAGAVEYIW